MNPEQKEIMFKKYINGTYQLDFKDINSYCRSLLVSTSELIEDYFINHYEESPMLSKSFFCFLKAKLPEYRLYDMLIEDCLNDSLNDIFFSDIKTNKEIIKIINEKINLDLDSASYDSEFKIDSTKMGDNDYKIKYAVNLFCSKAIDFLYELKLNFMPELVIKYKNRHNEFKEHEKKDKRISKYAPTNNERLKALTEFCPELINRLHNLTKEEQKQVINLITGVNKEDAYKKVITADRREIKDTIIKNDEIDIQDLKNKLNIT